MSSTIGFTLNSASDQPPAQPGTPPCHGFGGHPHPSSDRALRYISPEDRQQLIARLAYQNAERRGFAPGGELEDWMAAEVQVGEGMGDG
jgi:hypothetical protein